MTVLLLHRMLSTLKFVMHKTKSYCVVNNFIWGMWLDLVKSWPVPWRNNFAKKKVVSGRQQQRKGYSIVRKNLQCCIHSVVHRNKEFSMVHLVSVMMQKVVTWLSDVLSWKEVQNKQMWVNVLWIYLKAKCKYLGHFEQKSLNLTEDGFNCILHWLCHAMLLICDSIF